MFALVWGNAAWHASRRVRNAGGCRIRCGVPLKTPWLNPIEPEWVRGKRAVAAPDRKLTAAEVKERVLAHFDIKPTGPLKPAVG